MVGTSALLSVAAILSVVSAAVGSLINFENEQSLYAEIARNKDLQHIVQADMKAEEEYRKMPKKGNPWSKVLGDREQEDRKFAVKAQSIPKSHSVTVIGDSYSSGDGAYKHAGNGTCRRNEGSFGWRLNKILKPDNFQFLPCSGASVKDIQTKQIDSEKYGKPDLVLFTAGGDNNGAFVRVLLDCILPPSEKKCDKALEAANQMADNLPKSLAPLYQDIKSKSTSNRKREIIHLGYIQMYNRDKPIDQCPRHGTNEGSDVTWPSTGKDGYRDRINKAIIKINAKLREAAEQNGVTFVEVDALFSGHRFCDGPDVAWMQHRLSLWKEGGIICHPTWEGHSQYISGTLSYLASQQA